MYSWLRRNLSSKTEPQIQESPNSSSSEEELYGITNPLVEFAKSFTVDVFKNLSLSEDNPNGEAPRTSGGVQVDLSEWQQRHATLILSKVKDRQFWRIYFTLVKSYVIEYELRAIQLEKLRKMAIEEEKSSRTNVVELEMSDTKQRNNALPEDDASSPGEIS